MMASAEPLAMASRICAAEPPRPAWAVPTPARPAVASTPANTAARMCVVLMADNGGQFYARENAPN